MNVFPRFPLGQARCWALPSSVENDEGPISRQVGMSASARQGLVAFGQPSARRRRRPRPRSAEQGRPGSLARAEGREPVVGPEYASRSALPPSFTTDEEEAMGTGLEITSFTDAI